MKTASMALGYIGFALSFFFNFSALFYEGNTPEHFLFWVSVAGVLGAFVGLAGAILVKKKNILAGVFFCIGALVIPMMYSFILFVLAAIFAFIKEKKSGEAAGGQGSGSQPLQPVPEEIK